MKPDSWLRQPSSRYTARICEICFAVRRGNPLHWSLALHLKRGYEQSPINQRLEPVNVSRSSPQKLSADLDPAKEDDAHKPQLQRSMPIIGHPRFPRQKEDRLAGINRNQRLAVRDFKIEDVAFSHTFRK